jgi:hypothetical protein
MTLFAVAFFVIAALVLILGLMVRPLADEPPASARKRHVLSPIRKSGLPSAPASAH